MKRSRPLALFLSVLILISCFTVSVSAAEGENLIDSDLRNWTIPDAYSVATNVYYDKPSDTYFIQSLSTDVGSSDLKVKASCVYDLSNLISGQSYSFRFHLLDLDEVLSIRPSLTERNIYGGLIDGDGYYIIGLGSLNSTNGAITHIEDCSINITGDNYLDYFGKDNVISFELPNIVNPCIFIFYGEASTRSYAQYTFIRNVSLVDNEQAKEDGFFDRLFQFFHDLKWEIVGGSCGDSSCNKTPHTSLADKITNKVEELKKSFTDLRDSIDGFFDEFFEKIADFFGGFGNLILYFNWEGDYTNPFEREDSPIDKVSAFFDNLIEYVDSIGTSIENILDSITGGLHIFDEFTSRFPWLKGIAVFCLALIVITRFIGL